MLDGDLARAYDNTGHAMAIERLRGKGFSKVTVGAIFREVRRAKSSIRAGELRTTPVSRTRSLCQGGPDAPKLFNLNLDADIVWFQNEFQRRKRGIQAEPGLYIGVLTFADNFCFLSDSFEVFKVMCSTFLNRLLKVGWVVSLDECTWCTTDKQFGTSRKLIVNGQTIAQSPTESGFKVLRSIITFDNHSNLDFDDRLMKVWAAFRRLRPLPT